MIFLSGSVCQNPRKPDHLWFLGQVCQGKISTFNSFKLIIQLWDLRTGECLRSLDHEKQIRSVAIDGHRLLTGDMEGYVFAWDLQNVRDPEVGSDRLCMRAHNAMDPVVFDRNTEKPVYGVHLEQAAMIQV